MVADFAAYVFYVNRPDLLWRSITSFPELHSELTIVDNSPSGFGRHNSFNFFRPPVPLTYAQSMNWMLKDAIEKKVSFIVHFHSDAFSTNPDAAAELLKSARTFINEERKWACAWTFYDILWAINPKAMQDIGGWDINLPNYFGDQDARRRWALAEWECIDTNIQGVDHEGSATINSDPLLKSLNSITFPLYRQYYIAKWGGKPGYERFQTPFNNFSQNRILVGRKG